MKKIDVNFTGVQDTTGYLFSFAKSLSAVLRCSTYSSFADDVIAASGFAFRVWVDGKTLCPSATSIWSFRQQKPWIENSGLCCAYTERMWGEDAKEEERRLQALEMIRQSIDRGIAAVSWDISGCEWGIITGYDEEQRLLYTLKINGKEDIIPYEKLGKMDLPILSVLTVTGSSERTQEELLDGTKKIAAAHLRGREWCDNAKGLAAYDALIQFVEEKLSPDSAWNLEYMLGTYASLKWYAWKFFDKYGETELAALYKTVHEAWQIAFDNRGYTEQSKKTVTDSLRTARDAESKALLLLER